MKFKHKSVLLHETIDNLNPKDGGLYVDATFGGGGHARYLLSKLNKGTVIGFDQDEYAISMAKESFAKELQVGAEPRLMLVHDNFCHLKENLVDKMLELRICTEKKHFYEKCFFWCTTGGSNPGPSD